MCPSGTCSTYYSDSLEVSGLIYSFFIYGSTQRAYLAVISSDTGSVSLRYKSSISCSHVWGSGANGGYIAASIKCTSYYLLTYNAASKKYAINSFSGEIYGFGIEPTTGR